MQILGWILFWLLIAGVTLLVIRQTAGRNQPVKFTQADPKAEPIDKI